MFINSERNYQKVLLILLSNKIRDVLHTHTHRSLASLFGLQNGGDY